MSHVLYNIGRGVVVVLAMVVPTWLGAHTAVSQLTVGGFIVAILGWLETKFGVQTALLAPKVPQA